MILLVLLLIFPTLDSDSSHLYLLPDLMILLVLLFMPDLMILLVLLIIFHSPESTLPHLFLLPDLMILLVLLLIFPTLDSHSNSFVSTA